jgi:hypothetical protein
MSVRTAARPHNGYAHVSLTPRLSSHALALSTGNMRNRGDDVTLAMTVADATKTNAQAMAIYESDLRSRSRMIADAQKATLAHAGQSMRKSVT